jgi:hypothetical protein
MGACASSFGGLRRADIDEIVRDFCASCAPEAEEAHRTAVASTMRTVIKGRGKTLMLRSLPLKSLPERGPRTHRIERIPSIRPRKAHLLLMTLTLPLYAVSMLKWVAKMVMCENEIEVLPQSIGTLAQLEALALHENRIETLPDSLCSLRSLQTLFLHSNKIKQLPVDFGQLLCLTKLTLTSNELKDLPVSMGELSNLEVLSLSDNQLSSRALAPLGRLRSLKQLAVCTNKLTMLPPELCAIATLETLDCHGNMLDRLPHELGNLASLTSLDASKNMIMALPASICHLEHLEKIALRGNPLMSPPPAVVQRGIAAIRAWFPSQGGHHHSGNDDRASRPSANARASSQSRISSEGSERAGTRRPSRETPKGRTRPTPRHLSRKGSINKALQADMAGGRFSRRLPSKDMWKRARMVPRLMSVGMRKISSGSLDGDSSARSVGSPGRLPFFGKKSFLTLSERVNVNADSAALSA